MCSRGKRRMPGFCPATDSRRRPSVPCGDVATASPIVAERVGEVVGFVAVGASRDDDADGELYAIYVDPEHWGTGVGRKLIHAAETQLRVLAHRDVVLWVFRGQSARAPLLRGCRLAAGRRAEADRDTRRVASGSSVPEAAVAASSQNRRASRRSCDTRDHPERVAAPAFGRGLGLACYRTLPNVQQHGGSGQAQP